MPENLQQILERTEKYLAVFTEDAKIEAELLLSYSLNKPRSFLYSHPQTPISPQQQEKFTQLLNRRLKREPLSYILQQQAFWNIDLNVTKDVLIPRADTELLVEIIFENYSKNKKLNIADLGTGSGAIALSLAKISPRWKISATDISVSALYVAQQNAEKLQLKNVQFFLGNWCQALPAELFDIIVSNPPYIAKNDPHLLQPELNYEPKLALISGEKGLNAIEAIITQAGQFLDSGGMLLLEHGYNQASVVRKLFRQVGFSRVKTYQDLCKKDRATCGYLPF